MRITKDLGLFRHTEEYEYTPTIEEMFYYYSGTHAGFTRDNPYNRKLSVTKYRHKAVRVRSKVSDHANSEPSRKLAPRGNNR